MVMVETKLADIYKGQELKIVKSDLAQASKIIKSWVSGAEIDPDELDYISMSLMSLSEKFPQE